MKLLYATTYLFPDLHMGGIAHSAHELIAQFKSLLPEMKACGVSADPKRVAELNPYHPICVQSRFDHHRGFAPGFASAIRPAVEWADVVAINGVMSYPPTTAAKLCLKLNKPYVVTPRGGWLRDRRMSKPLRKKIYYHLTGKRILEGAAAIHVTSELEAESIEDFGLKRPIAIVPNGVETLADDELPTREQANAAWPELKGRVVLFLSRISPEKGLLQLIQSWADVKKDPTMGDVTLVIAGPDEHRHLPEVRKLIAQHQLNESVRIVGVVNGQRKWGLYRRSDVFILPSILSENFGNVVAEAMACAVPVITTTLTPWAELREVDAGRWVAPERGAIGDALRELLMMDNMERSAMGERGRGLVSRKYSWESAARTLVSIYESVLKKTSIPRNPVLIRSNLDKVNIAQAR